MMLPTSAAETLAYDASPARVVAGSGVMCRNALALSQVVELALVTMPCTTSGLACRSAGAPAHGSSPLAPLPSFVMAAISRWGGWSRSLAVAVASAVGAEIVSRLAHDTARRVTNPAKRRVA